MENSIESMDWLHNDGEVHTIIRNTDWSKTDLGPIQNWPQSLKTSLSICLSSKFPMFVWWGKDLTVFYNDAYIPFTGLKHPQYFASPAREQWAEIWDSLEPLTQQVLKTGKATWAESMLLYMTRKGFLEETYFTFSYSPIRDESGAIAGIINPCQETTEKVLSERRLKSLQEISAKEVKSIADAGQIMEGILSKNNLDIPFSLLYLTNTDNKSARLIGLSGIKENAKLSPSEINIEDEDSIWPLHEVYNTKKSFKVINLRKRFANDFCNQIHDEGPDSAYIIPLESAKRGVIGFVILGISSRLVFENLYESYFQLIARQIATHILNIYNLNEEKQRVEALEELHKAKTQFFSNISHELRTPLTLILGPLEDLLSRGSELSPQAHSELEVIYRNSIRLLKLVNNLLDFSRIESQRLEPTFEQVDLANLTLDLASGFSQVIEKAGLKFNVSINAINEKVSIDKEMWEKIVFNLLSNAFKYTLQGEISLNLQLEKNKIVLTVKDTGVGIPKKDLEKIFERFYRVANSKGRTYEGTGIGLSLVQELVKLHDGVIEVDSEVNVGSTFSVSIPLGREHTHSQLKSLKIETHDLYSQAFMQEAMILNEKEIGKNMATHLAPSKMGRIIFAEDNPDMRAYILKLLAQQYEVEAYENGEEALQAIRSNLPDLILTDIMMPVMNGLELIKEVRLNKNTAEIPIVLLSARAGEESTIAGIDSGADDYLVKPFSAKELLARVKQHITMHRVRKETSRLKDKFLANVSHELRSPLSSIIGFVSLINAERAGPISVEQKEYLGYVLSSSNHLLRLINELLDLAKIESGKMEFKSEIVDLKKVIEEVNGSLKSLIIEKNLTIDVIFTGENFTVMLDPLRLKQVLYNYISNAIKFTPLNGFITVSFKNYKNTLTIEVKDTGIGIKKENMSRLFLDFQQLNTDESLKAPGTGLGLALTKRIVEAQGGRVEVTSCFGKGSTFSAIYPLPT